MEARIWTWSWYIQTKVLRGELYEALDGLQYVRDRCCSDYWPSVAVTGPPVDGERKQSFGDRADGFARTVPASLDRAVVMEALRAQIDLYRLLAESVAVPARH